MTLDSFFVSLGFKIDTDKLDEFQRKAGELSKNVMAIGALASAAAVGIGTMVLKVAQGMDDVGDFADIVGMGAREVEALGKIARENDSSVAAMQASLQGIASATGQAALGVGRAAKIFEKLGLSARDADGNVKGAGLMLEEVADRVKDMGATEALAFTGRLGIDKTLIPLLRQGSAEFRRLREDAEAANPLTEEQYKQADEIVKLWNKATASMGVFTKRIAASLFPVMKAVLRAYNDWFKAGKSAFGETITAGIKSFLAIVGGMWDWIMRIVSAAMTVYKWLTQFKIVVWAAGAAIAALLAYQAGLFFMGVGAAILNAARALMMFNAAAALPAILIGGIVIAIAFLVDELVNFYEGNESIIGQLNEKFPGAIYAAWAALAALGAGFIAVAGSSVLSFGAVVLGWVTAGAAALAGGAAMAAAWIIGLGPIAWAIAAVVAAAALIWAYWDELSEFISTAWDASMQAIVGGVTTAVDWVVGIFKKAKDYVIGFVDTVTGAIKSVGKFLGLTDSAGNVSFALDGATDTTQGYSGSQIGATGGIIGGANNSRSSQTNNTTQITGTTITVNSPDPAKAGESVRNELDKMNRQAIMNGETAYAL